MRFECNWPDLFFSMIDLNFPDIPLYRKMESVSAVHRADRTEVVFPPNFPCALPGVKSTGYVEFRAVLRALVADNLYTWKDDLSEAENQDKIDVKVVNMKAQEICFQS